MIIELSLQERIGDQLAVGVFVGPEKGRLQLTGRLMLRVGEYQLLAAALRLGAETIGPSNLVLVLDERRLEQLKPVTPPDPTERHHAFLQTLRDIMADEDGLTAEMLLADIRQMLDSHAKGWGETP